MDALIEGFARSGFVAKAVVYLTLGTLTMQAAYGAGGRVTDANGVVTALADERYGRLLAGVLALGLVAYALWRFTEALADANHRGRNLRGLSARAAYAGSGFVYGLLAIDAGHIALGLPFRGSDSEVETVIGELLGRWGIPIAGAGLIAYGLLQTTRAARGRLSEQVDARQAVAEAGGWTVAVAQTGIAARGGVFMLVGYMLVDGWLDGRRSDAGTEGSLRLLASLSYGRWWLAAAGAGLFAFGIYQMIHARYRRVVPP